MMLLSFTILLINNCLGLDNPCAVTLCQAGSVCVVFRGEAICTSPKLADRFLCAKVNLQCPTPGSVCRVVNGQAMCVPPSQNPCANAPCGPATGTVCQVINGEAVCVPNTIG